MELPTLSYLYGQPEITALLRVQPDDFIVVEELSFTPTGAGEHMLLLVEKIGQNTVYVAKLLAELVGCKARQVSYAGLKDRHAVTRQWFCVPVPIKQQLNWQEWNIEGVKVLDSIRHQRRLKLGLDKIQRIYPDVTGCKRYSCAVSAARISKKRRTELLRRTTFWYSGR